MSTVLQKAQALLSHKRTRKSIHGRAERPNEDPAIAMPTSKALPADDAMEDFLASLSVTVSTSNALDKSNSGSFASCNKYLKPQAPIIDRPKTSTNNINNQPPPIISISKEDPTEIGLPTAAVLDVSGVDSSTTSISRNNSIMSTNSGIQKFSPQAMEEHASATIPKQLIKANAPLSPVLRPFGRILSMKELEDESSTSKSDEITDPFADAEIEAEKALGAVGNLSEVDERPKKRLSTVINSLENITQANSSKQATINSEEDRLMSEMRWINSHNSLQSCSKEQKDLEKQPEELNHDTSKFTEVTKGLSDILPKQMDHHSLMLIDSFVSSHINLLQDFCKMSRDMRDTMARQEQWVRPVTLETTKEYISAAKFSTSHSNDLIDAISCGKNQ